jgi:hypothetical protein
MAIDHEILDQTLDAQNASASCDLRAAARGIPLADFECEHGYLGAGPCACFQLHRHGELDR